MIPILPTVKGHIATWNGLKTNIYITVQAQLARRLANLLGVTQENSVILILQLAFKTLVKMQLADLQLHWL